MSALKGAGMRRSLTKTVVSERTRRSTADRVATGFLPTENIGQGFAPVCMAEVIKQQSLLVGC